MMISTIWVWQEYLFYRLLTSLDSICCIWEGVLKDFEGVSSTRLGQYFAKICPQNLAEQKSGQKNLEKSFLDIIWLAEFKYNIS